MKDAFQAGASPLAAWGTSAPLSAAIFDGLGPAKPAPSGSNRPLDVAQLLERCLGSRQLVERVLKSFESRFDEELQSVRAELTTRNVESLARAAHRLKGACANAAANELAGLASDVETAAREESFDRAQAAFDKLPDAWSRFLAASASFRQGGAS